MRRTRLLTPDDAPALATLVTANREFLAPWEPERSTGYFTVAGQRHMVRELLDQHGRGACLPHVVLDDELHVAGRITLSGITRGSFQSCSMGYWVSGSHNGRGLATAAVAEIVDLALGELGLHRVQAEVMPHNAASHKVLQRNGFTRIGFAPRYLKVAGAWQDHVMYQRLSDDAAPVGGSPGR